MSRLVWLSVALLALSLACNSGPNDSFTDQQPMVFPWEGRLGDGGAGSTISVLIDSNYIPGADATERYDLHKDRVAISLGNPTDDPGETPDWEVGTSLRYVMTLGAPPTAKRHVLEPGLWATIAVFDLPSASEVGSAIDPTPITYPFFASARVEIDGEVVFVPRIEITGPGGEPNTLMDETLLAQGGFNSHLEPQRMIRLRGKRDEFDAPGSGRFYSGQGFIGSIEFDFEYFTLCVTDVRVAPSTEASLATAAIGPPVSTGAWSEEIHVVLVHPDGFKMVFMEPQVGFPDYGDPTMAGSGPFLDIPVEDYAGASCDIGDPSVWKIRNLVVSDLNGNPIVDIDGDVLVDTASNPDGDATLRLYAVDVDDT